MYRIYLNGIEDCHQWRDRSITEKVSSTGDQIIHGILSQAQCDWIPNFIALNGKQAYFSCPKNKKIKDSVIYNFHLLGSPMANTTLLVSCLDQWIQDSIIILVHGANLQIIKECSGVLNNGISTECSYGLHGTKKPWEVWLSITFAGVIVILIGVTIMISIKFW